LKRHEAWQLPRESDGANFRDTPLRCLAMSENRTGAVRGGVLIMSLPSR
jgi:hypothetical protein